MNGAIQIKLPCLYKTNQKHILIMSVCISTLCFWSLLSIEFGRCSKHLNLLFFLNWIMNWIIIFKDYKFVIISFHTDFWPVCQPLQRLVDSTVCTHLQAEWLRQRSTAQRASVLDKPDGVLWYWKPTALTVCSLWNVTFLYVIKTSQDVLYLYCECFSHRFPIELHSSRDF